MDPRSPASEGIDTLRLTGSTLHLCGADVTGRMYCRFIHEGRLAIATDGSVSPCLSLLHNYHYYYRQYYSHDDDDQV